MQIEELLTQADHLKQEAKAVIKETGIVDILSKIGKIDFVGSYVLNLLYRPDIDLFVSTDNCSRDKAVATTKEILDNDLFQTVGYANWTKEKAPNSLPGYYWELVVYKNEKRWKFDVWYTSEQKIMSIEKTQKILAKLRDNPDARGKILQLKNELFDGVKYKDNMNGFKIYEKVLGEI